MPTLVPALSRPAPALPGGRRTVCTGCDVSVHEPHTEEDCRLMQAEREYKRLGDW